RRDEAAHLEEERRLFHVAITRAERTFAALHATREADGNGGDAGAGASAQRSPFLDLLPKAAVSARAVGAEEDEFPRHRARAPGFAAAAPPPFAGFATAATIRDAVFDDDHAGAEDEAPPRPPPVAAAARRPLCAAHRVACVRRDDGSLACALGPGRACDGAVLEEADADRSAARAPPPPKAKPGAGKITAFFKKAPKGPPKVQKRATSRSPSPPPRPPAPTPAAEEPTPASEPAAPPTAARPAPEPSVAAPKRAPEPPAPPRPPPVAAAARRPLCAAHRVACVRRDDGSLACALGPGRACDGAVLEEADADRSAARAPPPPKAKPGAGKITAFFKKAPKGPPKVQKRATSRSPSPPPRPPAPTPAAEEPTPASEPAAPPTAARPAPEP
ncbi:hypothetical protein AURANDRAFT_69318, partial [Aureococcus anophagefferens]